MIFARSAACLTAALLFCGAAIAQEPDKSAAESVERNLNNLNQVEDLKAAAAGAPIPFEAVLAAPENVKLNLAYARQRIEAGDLKEAASALDRVLLIDPNLAGARVIYGLVLFRMQMYDRARYELEKALEGELSAQARAEANRYLDKIKRLQKRTRGSITLTAGVEYDSNRNESPSSGNVLFRLFNTQFILPGEPRNGDAAYITSVQARMTHDLGMQNGATLFGEADYYRSDKIEVDKLDLDAVTVAGGVTWNWGDLTITPEAHAAYLYLEHDNYLKSFGGQLELLLHLRPDLRTYLVLRGDDEIYMPVPDFQADINRNGRRLTARAGVNWNINQEMQFTVEGLAEDKNAAKPFEAFNRYGAYAQHVWLHGRGAFTLVGLWAQHSGYDGPDPFVTLRTRSDWLYRARVSAGAPISWFLPHLQAPNAVKDINIIAQYEYERVDSNILNYDYHAHKVELLLSKRFSF
ncbi:MAG TPA: hypothetical protein VNH64_03195 [Parvularculaceae bacterium]|nr:hypothetical protein [Parvularculaceae bacterium]